MLESEYLVTIAEIAAVFVGFAAIVLALRQRESRLEDADRTLLRWLVERGFAALVFAMAPLLLGFFDVSEAALWRGCCAGLFAYLASTLIRSLLAWRRDSAIREMISAGNYFFRFGASSVVAVAELLAAAGLLLTSTAAWYLLGVSWLLVLSAMIFVTILRGREA